MPLEQYPPWINLQSSYLRQFGKALNRITEFNMAAVNNALWNAQRNVNAWVKTTATA